MGRGRRWSQSTPWRLGLTALIVCGLALAEAKAGHAQPSGTNLCTVSVLNQTANVRLDGSWDMANIPSNMGPVRARLTCIDSGVTTSGSSEFFAVADNRMNAIPPIPLGGAPPTPTRIGLVPLATTLTSVGASLQLTVTRRG